MDSKFRIEGKNINLRTTIKSDLINYEKWNSTDLKAYQFDGPWYKTKELPLNGGKDGLKETKKHFIHF